MIACIQFRYQMLPPENPMIPYNPPTAEEDGQLREMIRGVFGVDVERAWAFLDVGAIDENNPAQLENAVKKLDLKVENYTFAKDPKKLKPIYDSKKSSWLPLGGGQHEVNHRLMDVNANAMWQLTAGNSTVQVTAFYRIMNPTVLP